MPEYMDRVRNVAGPEAFVARSFSRWTIRLADGTKFIRVQRADVNEDKTNTLHEGWYQVSPRGVVVHWARKADVLAEIGQLLRID